MTTERPANVEARLRRGQRLIFAGLVAQLSGSAADAVMHGLRPALAQEEGLLTVGNPTHALVFSGMLLVGLGILCAVPAGAGGRGSRGLSAPLAVAAPISLAPAVLALALGTGLLSGGGHQHQRGGGGPDERVVAELKGVFLADGPRAALAHLDRMATGRRLRTHAIVHEIGRLTYLRYADVQTAFRRCGPEFQGGCHHGVLETHFKATGRLPASGLSRFCATLTSAPRLERLTHACTHGLGHALLGLPDATVSTALRLCDRLPRRIDRNHCYGGVFMQVVSQEHPSHSGKRQAEPSGPRRLATLCDSLPLRYRWDCYGAKPASLLITQPPDIEAAFRSCERSPPPYDIACHQGVGNAIPSVAAGESEQPTRWRRMCALAHPRYESACFGGIVRSVLLRTWRGDDAIEFCRRVPVRSAPSCFETVGWLLPNTEARPANANSRCRTAHHPVWIRACREGAGRRLEVIADEDHVPALRGRAVTKAQ